MPNARRLATTLELHLDRCIREYGQAPCTAAIEYALDAAGGQYILGALWGDRVAAGHAIGEFGKEWYNINGAVAVNSEGVGAWQAGDNVLGYLWTHYELQDNYNYLLSFWATGGDDTTSPFLFWWGHEAEAVGFGLFWNNANLTLIAYGNAGGGNSTVIANTGQLPPGGRYPFTILITRADSSPAGSRYGIEVYITKPNGDIIFGSIATDFPANKPPSRLYVGGAGWQVGGSNSWNGTMERIGIVRRPLANYFTTAERRGWRPETGARRYGVSAQCFNTLATCQDEANYSDQAADRYGALAGYSNARYYGVPGNGGTAGFESATGEGAALAQMTGNNALVTRNSGAYFEWNDNDNDKQALVSEGLPFADGDRYIIAMRARRAADNTYPMTLGLGSKAAAFTTWNTGADGGKIYMPYLADGYYVYRWGQSPGVRAQVMDSAFALYAANQWLWYITEVTRVGNTISARTTVNDGGGDTGAAGVVATMTAAWADGDSLYVHVGGAALNGYYSWDDSIGQIAIAKAAAAHSDNALRAMTAADIVALQTQDPARRIYRFCNEGAGIDGYWDNIIGVSDKPAGLKADFDLWQRERVDITLADSPAKDAAGDDPYAAIRVIPINIEGGYLARLFARNRHFIGRKAVVKYGWLDGGAFYAAQTRNLYIRNWSRNTATGQVKIELDDGMSITKKQGALCPPETAAVLFSAITAAATTLLASADIFLHAFGHDGETGHLFNLPAVAGREFAIRIGDEIMTVSAVANVTGQEHKLLTVGRGAHGTVAVAHEAGEEIGGIYIATNRNIVDVAADVLTYFCDLRGATLDTDMFTDERNGLLATYAVSGILAEPAGADEALAELQKSGQFALWYDSASGKVKIRSALNLAIIDRGQATLTDDDIARNSVKLKEEPAKSISRAVVYYEPVKPLEAGGSAKDYAHVYVGINQNIERAAARGFAHEKQVFTRWLNDTQAAELVSRMLPQGELDYGIMEFDLPFYPDRAMVELGANVPLRIGAYRGASGEIEEYVLRVLQVEVRGEVVRVRGVRTIYGGNGIRPFVIGEDKIGDTEKVIL